jgi:DHA3 family tetracycline resistance protein-like MFS transporter
MPDNRQAVLRAYFLFRLIAPFVFAMWICVAGLYFASRISSDPFQLAILGVVLESSTFLFEIPTGLVADVYSRKWSIVIGYILWGIGFLIQGIFQNYTVVLVSQAIWGLGFTFVSGAPEAWLVDELGEEEAMPLFVRGAQLAQISSILGIISATLIGSIDVALPIVVGGAGTLLLAAILAVMMPEKRFKPVQHENTSRWNIFETFFDSVREVRGKPVLKSVIWIGFIIGSSAGGFDAMYSPHILQNFEIPLFEPVVWFGIISGGVMVLTIPSLELAKRHLQKNPKFPVSLILAAFALGTVLGNLMFVWVGGFYGMLLAFWLSQTLRNATKPLFMAWISRHSSSGVRATVISMYWQSNAFGNIFGVPILGMIGSLSSLRLALTLSALALLPVIPIYYKHRADNEARD